MTTEQKLAAIIEAQVKGGYDGFAGIKDRIEPQDSITKPLFWAKPDGHQLSHFHPLEILLDRAGLRAAYGESVFFIDETFVAMPADNPWGREGGISWEVAARRILDAWLSGGSEAAIQTAFNLLPSQA